VSVYLSVMILNYAKTAEKEFCAFSLERPLFKSKECVKISAEAASCSRCAAPSERISPDAAAPTAPEKSAPSMCIAAIETAESADATGRAHQRGCLS